MKKKIKARIIGGAGYTGGEMIRLLMNHQAVELIFVHSKSNAGKNLHAIHQDLIGETEMIFSETTNDEINVLFLCVGHGDSKKYMEQNEIPDHVKIISLSEDFRLKKNSIFQDRTFIYGLPEFFVVYILLNVLQCRSILYSFLHTSQTYYS